MGRFSRLCAVVAVGVSILAVAACDSDGAITGTTGASSRVVQMTDSELRAQVSRAQGRVAVGFKDRDARYGVNPYGVVVVSPETVWQGLSLLHAMGIEVQQVFMGGASVAVNVTPHQAVWLRRYRIVEYVQPNVPVKRGDL